VDAGKTLEAGWEKDGEKHSDRKMSFTGVDGSTVEMQFWW
jgi:hypothetical protein